MKAIVTKYLPATNTKPSRVKAKAEGVSAITISYNSYDDPQREAALTLCRKYKWGEDIVGGGLPDQTGECFVFVGEMAAPPSFKVSLPRGRWRRGFATVEDASVFAGQVQRRYGIICSVEVA